MKWLEAADDWGMKRMWNGAESWVKANDNNLKPGSDEFYQAVGKKFDEVLYNSQSNSTTLQKAAIMRSDNSLTKSVTLFQNQFYTVYNQMLTAAGDLEYARKTGEGKKEAAQKLALTAAGLIASSLASALVTGLRDKLYGREPEGMIKETFRNVVSYLPFGSIAFDFADGVITGFDWNKDFNGLQASNIGMINTFAEDVIALSDTYRKAVDRDAWNWREGKKLLAAPVRKVAFDLSKLSGVPVSNFEKFISGLVGVSLDTMVKFEILPESFAGVREGYQNYFEDFDKSDLSSYTAKNKTSLAFKSMFGIVLDNSLNKGDLFNKNKLDSETKKELFRLYKQNNETDVVPNPNKSGLTFSLQIDYGKEYGKTVQSNLSGLLQSDLYKAFSDEDKIKAIAMLYSYANGVSSKSVIEDYEPDKWISNFEAATKYFPAYKAIALRTKLSGVESVKDEDGKTIANSKSLLMRELIGNDLRMLSIDERKSIYEALGISKTVAEMDAQTFRSELEKIKKYLK